MRDLTQDERETLERMIDAAGLGSVLEALSEVCDEKAEHIRVNWQDSSTARAWAEACGVIGVARCRVNL